MVGGKRRCRRTGYCNRRTGLPLAGLVTATYPIEQYEEAYRRYMGGLEGKVVLTH